MSNTNYNCFKENVVIVTGAASGIGRALALNLTDQGAWLALADRHGEKLEETGTECRRRGGKVLTIPTDVTEQSLCGNLIERTVSEYGRIDTLINNAGITMLSRFDEIGDLSLFEELIRVNLFGSVYCTHYAIPHLKERRGRLVGISSLAGKTGLPMRSAYAASKHAVAGFFDTLRMELAGDGVSVTTIYPGFVATDLRRSASGRAGGPVGESPVREAEAMSADACAGVILRATARRKREVIMTFRGKLGLWLKLIAPSLVDRMAQRAGKEGR